MISRLAADFSVSKLEVRSQCNNLQTEEKIQLSTYNGTPAETVLQELITKACLGGKLKVFTTDGSSLQNKTKKDLRKNEKDPRRKARESRQTDSSEDVKTRILRGRRLWESQESTGNQQQPVIRQKSRSEGTTGQDGVFQGTKRN